MIKAVFETTMKEMPDSCSGCDFSDNCPNCWLYPDKRVMRLLYYKRRPSICPLVEESED